MSPSLSFDGRAAMRWYVSIGVVLIAGVLAGGDVASFAAPNPANRPGQQLNAGGPQLADKEANPTVDVDLGCDQLRDAAVRREPAPRPAAGDRYFRRWPE